jgi:hypothetical protein
MAKAKKQELTPKLKKQIKDALNNGEITSAIAKSLSIPETYIVQYIKEILDELAGVNKEKKATAKKASKKPTAKDLMIRKTSEQKRKGVAIMTKEASELVDAHNQGMAKDGDAFLNKYAGAIHSASQED